MLFKIQLFTSNITIIIQTPDCFTRLCQKFVQRRQSISKPTYTLVILNMFWHTVEISKVSKYVTKTLENDCFIDVQVGKL